MKLATYSAPNGQRIAAILPQTDGQLAVLDLQSAHQMRTGQPSPALAGMIELIQSGQAGLDMVAELLRGAAPDDPSYIDLGTVRLESPIPQPIQLRDFSVFEQHLRDAPVGLARLEARALGRPEPAPGSGSVASVYRDYPLFYYSNRMNVAGQGVHLEWPVDMKLLDYELEVAAVIGKTGRDIPAKSASEYIFGYSVFNDVSARDYQWRQMKGGVGPCKSKSCDNFNVIGPWIVTRDELPEIRGLRASVRVNGETWIETRIDGMLHSFDQMIAFASQHETIHAGEVFGSGTVGGCCGLESDRWVATGDVVELEVERIGTLVCHYGE